MSRTAPVALAAPIVAYAGFELISRILLPPFLTGTVGLSLGLAGAIILGLRLVDLFTDLGLGVVADAVSLRGGRRAIVTLGATIALPATALFAFADENMPLPVMVGLISAALLGWSLLNAAQAALSLESASGIGARSQVFAWRAVAAIVGFAGVALVTTAAGADPGRQIRWAASALLVATPFLLIFSWVRVCEPPKREERFRIANHAAAIAIPWRDFAHARLGLLFALSGAHGAVWATGFAFVIGNAFALPALLGPALLLQAVAAIIGAFIWLLVVRRAGARTALTGIFGAEAAFCLLAFAVPSGDALFALIWVAGRGLAAGAEIMVLRALSGDVLDADRVRNGLSNAGANAAAFQFPFALAAAFAGAAVLWGLQAVGFDPGASEPHGQWRPVLWFTAGTGFCVAVIALGLVAGLKPDRMQATGEGLISDRDAEFQRV